MLHCPVPCSYQETDSIRGVMGSREAYRHFEVKGSDPLEPCSIGYGLNGLGFEPRQAKEYFLFLKQSDRLWAHLTGVLPRGKVARM
jgi:hypothetical protein